MKFGRIKTVTPDGVVQRIVAVQPEANRVIDLAWAYRLVQQRRGADEAAAARLARVLFPSSMAAAIAAGPVFRDAAETALGAADDASIAIDAVDWAAAVDPPVIRDGLTYPLHMEHFSAKVGGGLPNPQIFKTPPYFKGATGVIVGHDESIAYPSFTDYLDYELEIGLVVGGGGRNLTPEQAEERLFGYTIFNDFSARDLQAAEMGMGMGPQKCKDFAFGIGPWIVTRDEMPPLAEVNGTVTVNGEQWSTCTADGGIYSPAELVAWVSLGEQLQPGDLIGTGTLGWGAGLEIDRKLNPGDVLELQLDGVGVLRTPIGERETVPWRPEEKPYPFSAAAAH
ncbi:fumarylacetoacetate hydrolase family protein [Gordonia sp. CPCC 205515]|uniref:fumarylacetoacetate hydrolase family protein n=1 Tax=Gordonia sp. CPCC 205515 TaxID=3140791 RepID=UPI003AF40529